ncbi:hypothetical protein BH11ACT2_BH11ACT2_14450 [soil metagenome]
MVHLPRDLADTRAIPVTRYDGNAIAGRLGEIFHADMTMATVECKTCASTMLIADTIVEMDDAGFIVLCPSCAHTLFTVVHTEQRVWIDLNGVSGLGI